MKNWVASFSCRHLIQIVHEPNHILSSHFMVEINSVEKRENILFIFLPLTPLHPFISNPWPSTFDNHQSSLCIYELGFLAFLKKKKIHSIYKRGHMVLSFSIWLIPLSIMPSRSIFNFFQSCLIVFNIQVFHVLR